jgi:hypothetical protein
MTCPKILLVLGSGATAGGGFRVSTTGTLWKPPMDFNWFETPIVQTLLRPGDYSTLEYYRQSPALEATWAKIDLYYKLCNIGWIDEENSFAHLEGKMRKSNIPGYCNKLDSELGQGKKHLCVPSMALWELRHQVLTVFRDIKENAGASPSCLRSLIAGLQEKQMIEGIVSFNYDTCLDQTLDPQSFYYPCLGETEKGFPLMKLHGSLNLQYDSDLPRASKIKILMPPTMRAVIDHAKDGHYKQPEMIGPTFFKQEIALDVNREDRRMEYYRDLWHFSWQKLKDATCLLFVGFSFPQTDFHAAALFRTAHLSGSGFRRVILCHFRDPNLRRTADQVFAGNKMPEFSEFPEGLEDMADRLDELLGLLAS